ncbi:MAG: hypothetical protein Q4Q04_01185 [Methanocorpusculum sp.]|nr:hypothetical protein [Methanocorpusculum sp.]
MIYPFQVLKREGRLNDTVRAAFISAYGRRGMEAFDAVADNRVKKYKDYFVVVGNNNEYFIEGTFCSCDAARYGKECWHTLAVRIAVETGVYETYDLWYYKKGVDEDEEEYEKQ